MKYKQRESEKNNEFVEDVQCTLEETNLNKRRKCTISDTMIKLLVRQLKHELYNHNLYRTFANFFGTQGLTLLEKYYIDRANEERLHHDWIANYLSTCDAIFTYPEIPAITETFENNIKPFELTVDVEIETTNLIYEIVDQALLEKDWSTYHWLLNDDEKTGMLVKEQIEEENISRTALDIANENDSWLIKEKSIMNAYQNDLN